MNFVHPHLRLGVNVDHVATVRNARGGVSPDPVRAAGLAATAGADGITAHLREDRRHIVDADIRRLMEEVALPLNLEMAATDDMVAIALAHRPHAICLVPERRAELTTEGGLDVAGAGLELAGRIGLLAGAGIRVSLFVDPSIEQIEASKAAGAAVVELHTGSYCHAEGQARRAELERLQIAARAAHGLGLEVHAGHGLDYETVVDVAAIPELAELNIGHFLIGEAIFEGLVQAIAKMRAAMAAGRRQGTTN